MTLTCPCLVYLLIPHISSKTGVNGGKSISLIFYPKHRLWVFVTTKRRSYFPKDGLTLSNSKSDGIPDGGLSRVNQFKSILILC